MPTTRWLGQAGFTFLLAFFCGVVFSWPYWSRPEYLAPGFMFLYYFLSWLAIVLLLFVMGAGLRSEPPDDDSQPPEIP